MRPGLLETRPSVLFHRAAAKHYSIDKALRRLFGGGRGAGWDAVLPGMPARLLHHLGQPVTTHTVALEGSIIILTARPTPGRQQYRAPLGNDHAVWRVPVLSYCATVAARRAKKPQEGGVEATSVLLLVIRNRHGRPPSFLSA